MSICTIQFRGQPRDVEYQDSGYDPACNSRDIEWSFVGLTIGQHEDLKITDAEDASIIEQIVEHDDRDDGFEYARAG